MNKWIGIGRLCGDVTYRQTNSGTSMANYRIAVDRRFKHEGQPEADFFNVVAFGSQADFAQKYLHKGIKIAIEGHLQTRNYDDKDGKKVYVTEIVIDRHEFCEPKRTDSGSYAMNQSNNYPSMSSEFTALEDDDDSLPF